MSDGPQTPVPGAMYNPRAQAPVPVPPPARDPRIDALGTLVVGLLTGGIIPKGYLTKAASALQVVSGVGVLAGILSGVLGSPDPVPFADIREPLIGGLFLLGNGMGTMGLGRKSEKIVALSERTDAKVDLVDAKAAPGSVKPVQVAEVAVAQARVAEAEAEVKKVS